jgi:hypothetical protein
MNEALLNSVNQADGAANKFSAQVISLDKLETELLSLQVIGDYSNEDTPFDQFDTDCHQDEEMLRN